MNNEYNEYNEYKYKLFIIIIIIMNILMNIFDTLPDNNNNKNIKLFILDPLSVIIKLAIISNKPVGTKILIQNNIVYFQEPGMFQAVARYFLNTNKTDLQYLYNPIHIACQYFLSPNFIETTPRINSLFECAKSGIERLKETYKNSPMICLCLNYYTILISNYLDQKYNENMFCKDGMTNLYIAEIINTFHLHWTKEKINIVLELIHFLTNNKTIGNNVLSLENIMNNIDKETHLLIENI